MLVLLVCGCHGSHEAYKTGRVEYLEDELNKLMHEKKKNEDGAKVAFDTRVKETRKKAIEDKLRMPKIMFLLKLTHIFNSEGELVNDL